MALELAKRVLGVTTLRKLSICILLWIFYWLWLQHPFLTWPHHNKETFSSAITPEVLVLTGRITSQSGNIMKLQRTFLSMYTLSKSEPCVSATLSSPWQQAKTESTSSSCLFPLPFSRPRAAESQAAGRSLSGMPRKYHCLCLGAAIAMAPPHVLVLRSVPFHVPMQWGLVLTAQRLSLVV